MTRWIVVVALAMGCQGCPPPTPQPPGPVDGGSADVSPEVVDNIARACLRLRELGCPAGSPTPNGDACEEVLRATEATGYTTSHPECVPMASSCEEADRLSAGGCD